MSETEQFEPISEQEAQRRIQSAFLTLDAVYNLHAPKDPANEVWECGHCEVAWPCETERIILDGLELATASDPDESEDSLQETAG
jgi:hypothetical protein